jgi:hypothetical protein
MMGLVVHGPGHLAKESKAIDMEKDRPMGAEFVILFASLFLLGLSVMGLMFAFVYGCERV